MEKKFLTINGIRQTVIHHPDSMLADVLRNQIHVLGVKKGCGQGHCGACSVILNGKLTLSCIVRMERVPDESTILTVEGIGTPGKLHPIQAAFVTRCRSMRFLHTGFVVHPTRCCLKTQSQAAGNSRLVYKHHNVCRCNGYETVCRRFNGSRCCSPR